MMADDRDSYDDAFSFVDVPSIVETFADGVHLVHFNGSTGRVVFTVSRIDTAGRKSSDSTGTKTVALRLVMPMTGMVELYNRLHLLITRVEETQRANKELGDSTVQ